MNKTGIRYEVISINKITREITRGGIKLTYKTASKYAVINANNDNTHEYYVELADNNAVSLRTYYNRLNSVQ